MIRMVENQMEDEIETGIAYVGFCKNFVGGWWIRALGIFRFGICAQSVGFKSS